MEKTEKQKQGGEEFMEEKEKREEIPCTPQEQRFLRSYEQDLQILEKLTETELEELLWRAEQGEDLAKAKAAEQFLGEVLELARELRSGEILVEDLVQEGNVGLLLALETLSSREAGQSAKEYVLAEIRRAMEEAAEEAREVHRAGEEIVGRVSRLSDSILQLKEELGDQMSIEELSAFLDMSIDEIESILKLAGE